MERSFHFRLLLCFIIQLEASVLLPCQVEICTVATILARKEVFAGHRRDVKVQWRLGLRLLVKGPELTVG